MQNIPGAWPASPKSSFSTPQRSTPDSNDDHIVDPVEQCSPIQHEPDQSITSPDVNCRESRSPLFPSHMRKRNPLFPPYMRPITPKRRRHHSNRESAERIANANETRKCLAWFRLIASRPSGKFKPPVTAAISQHRDEESRIEVEAIQTPTTRDRDEEPRIEVEAIQTPATRDRDEEPRIEVEAIQTPTTRGRVISNLESQCDRLKQRLSDRDEQLDACKRELEMTSAKVQEKEDIIAGMKEDKVALERRIEKDKQALEEEVEAHAKCKDKLQVAAFRAEVCEYFFDKRAANDEVICKYRQDVNAQFLRANEAEAKVRRLENVLNKAHSELEQGRDAREEIETLQQQLDASVASSQKAQYEIQKLQKALETSNNNITNIYQQGHAYFESIKEEASQEIQKVVELGSQVEARANEAELANRGLQQEVQRVVELSSQMETRANQAELANRGLQQEVQRVVELSSQMETRANQAELANRGLQHANAEQATAIGALQLEAQKWKALAEDCSKRATAAERELEGKLEQKTRQLEEHNTRATNADTKIADLERKVSDLERQIFNLETDATQREEAARNPSSNPEADIALTNQAERLERELEEATELLEEVVGSSEMDPAYRDALETLVYTNQCFKAIENEFEDNYAATVDGLNSILEDAIPNLDDLHLIDNTEKPILPRQLKEAHGVRQRIDEILEDAQLLGEVYLDAEETAKIKEILSLPRTLSGEDGEGATLISPTSPPQSRSPSPSPPPPASQPTISSPAPLYNPPRPQQPTSTTPLHLPGLQLTAPTASPTTGAPPPFNPLWATPQTAAPTPQAPSALASLGSSLLPLLNDLPQPTTSSSSDSDSDSDVMPEAFEGQYDEESSDEEEAPKVRVPPVGQRQIRQPVSRRRKPNYPKAADFM